MTTNSPEEKENKIENEKEIEKEKEEEKSEEIKPIDNDVINQQTCMPHFFDNLPYVFKYKNPPDYYIIPIFIFLIILVLELLSCLKILNLSYYCLTYFILGIIFKIILIIAFALSFETGYEYFFDIISIILMIYIYLTLTFLIFNLCNKNSNNELKSNNKCLWFLSLLACIISDYRCLELFTRTKIEILNSNNEKESKNKKGKIKINKTKNKDVYNFKNHKYLNDLDINSNENDATDAKFKIGNNNKQIIEEKNVINKSSFEDSNAMFNLQEKNRNLFNIDNNRDIYNYKIENVKEKEGKYLLVQDSCINKLIIMFDILFVNIAFIIICAFIIYKYKTYSALYFFSIYGIIIALINIIYYYRFKYITINIKEKLEQRSQEIKIRKKQKIIENNQNNKINNDIIQESIPKHHNKNIGSSLGKLLGTNNSIKEALPEDEQTHEEKNININQFNTNIINLDKNMKPAEIENEDDIIYNPYREDYMSDLDSKKSKNKKNNMNMPEINIKEINNKNAKNVNEEYNILKTYRSYGSEDMKIGSMDSRNPINNFKEFNSKLFDNKNENQNEQKLDEDEDNSSVIHNPIRDDINN